VKIKTLAGTSVAMIGALALATGPSLGAGASQAASTKQVTAAFTKIFNASANKSAREGEVQNASHYKTEFAALFASAVAKANPTAAVVTKVTFPSASACTTAAKISKCALVTYNLNSAKTGAALLPGATGYAANVNGKWFVSDTTFCSLAKLAGVACTG
jgi:hypothetical protein